MVFHAIRRLRVTAASRYLFEFLAWVTRAQMCRSCVNIAFQLAPARGAAVGGAPARATFVIATPLTASRQGARAFDRHAKGGGKKRQNGRASVFVHHLWVSTFGGSSGHLHGFKAYISEATLMTSQNTLLTILQYFLQYAGCSLAHRGVCLKGEGRRA